MVFQKNKYVSTENVPESNMVAFGDIDKHLENLNNSELYALYRVSILGDRKYMVKLGKNVYAKACCVAEAVERRWGLEC